MSILRNTPIATRLYGIAGILLAAILALSVVTLSNMAQTNESFASTYNDRVVPLQQLKVVADMYAVNIVDTVHKTRNSNIDHTTALQNVNEAQKRIHENWQAYMATYLTPEEKRLADEAQALMEKADKGVEKIKGLLTARNNTQIAEFSASELYPAIDPISGKISDLVDLQLREAKAMYNTSAAAYATNRAMTIGIITLSLIVGLALAYFTIRSILNPMNMAVGMASRIASGDLTGHIEVEGKDETAQLLHSLESMRVTLTGMIANISGISGQLSQSAQSLTQTTQQVSVAASSQAEAAASMAAAVEEVTVSINHVSDNAREAHEASSKSGELSTQGQNIIVNAATEIGKISHEVQEAANTIQDLGEKSTHISAVVKVIREVAEQTNLLALNAAIEAARAGEQGRGFAVVADEVRKLAERTTQSAQEISNMISGVQSGATAAVQRMDNVVDRVGAGVQLANQAGDAIRHINDGARHVVSAVNDISSALSEQGIAANDIARSVEHIAQMAEENSAAVGETFEAARNLESMAEELQVAVNRFRVAA